MFHRGCYYTRRDFLTIGGIITISKKCESPGTSAAWSVHFTLRANVFDEKSVHCDVVLWSEKRKCVDFITLSNKSFHRVLYKSFLYKGG